MFGFDMWLVWFLAGIVIGTAEMAIPGFIVMFFGIGCWGAAVAALVLPDACTLQVGVFLVVSIVSLISLRRFAMKIFAGTSKGSEVEEISDSSVEPGTQISVDDGFEPGIVGRVRYRGTLWYAKSAVSIRAHSTAVITGVDEKNRSCLMIEPVFEPVDDPVDPEKIGEPVKEEK